jgi:hypothetical protein
MKWIGKITAGVATGIIAAVLAAYVTVTGAGGGPEGGEAGAWAMLIGFAIVLTLALAAKTTKKAWGYGILICALLSFAIPLAGVLYGEIVGSRILAEDQTLGAAIGVRLGKEYVAQTLAIFGFFLGLILLVIAILLLRGDGQAKDA